MASSASLSRALAGLLQNVQLLLGESETAALLPQKEWLPDQEAKAAATWATTIAALDLNYQPQILAQHSQRQAIFSHLYGETAVGYIPLRALQLEKEHIFPQTEPQSEAQRSEAYGDLRQELVAGLKAIQATADSHTYLLALNDLLRRTTWCLPNPYFPAQAGLPDTSLYDLSRVVAALAPCHADHTSDKVATLISGDISGVQDFIYTITARGATSGLRGRSLYLQLLTEAIAHYILTNLELPTTSLLYAGGGHFYIIAPASAEAAIPNLRRQISRILLRHHQGELYLALGCHTFSQSDFQPQNFGDAWSQLSQATSRAKRRRFSELAAEMYSQLFQLESSGGDKEQECRVCHYEARPDETMKVETDNLDDAGAPIRKCHLCESLEELGQELRNAHYLLLQPLSPASQSPRGRWPDTLQDFGLGVSVLQKLPTAVPPPGSQLLALNDAAYKQARQQKLPALLRYTVNVTPGVTESDIADYRKAYPNTPERDLPRLDRVKPFDLLQIQAQGIKRLGVLRMDVDNLGDIFAHGFGQQGGLVKTAALSFALSLYFEGWVGELAAQASEGRDVVYSIYSGGDDLFIVGAWDTLPSLAHDIAGQLQAYAAHHPRFHASAGITLHGGKFPLYQAATAAEAALEAAKEHQHQEQKKNAFTFLDRTRPWQEFDQIAGDFEHLCQLIAGKAPRSLLQQLVLLDALYQRHKKKRLGELKPGEKEPTVYWGPWHWYSAYQLSRMARQNQAVGSDIEALRDRLKGEGFRHIERLGLSARWAELYLRD